MPIVEWSETFSVGIGEIDQHHRHLMDLLNKLYDDFSEGSAAKDLGPVLDELVDYATYHFSCEERWMTQSSYPKLPEHRGEHERFIRRVNEIQKDFLNTGTRVYLETLTFVKNWLTNHILQTDAEYGRYIAAGRDLPGVAIRLD
jgi:hemerythrin